MKLGNPLALHWKKTPQLAKGFAAMLRHRKVSIFKCQSEGLLCMKLSDATADPTASAKGHAILVKSFS